MQAVVDSVHGDCFRCLLENGDLINVHKADFPDNVNIGDIVKISFERDAEASLKQKELMK
ncbi:MAG: DUF3006 family protein [Candidatus Riflebacteria bacterium]|nr:DUF3006 family protein [Candidatus Riflebacteria bacterium]